MSSGDLGPLSRRRGGSADDTPALEQELARIHREMQRRFGDQVRFNAGFGAQKQGSADDERGNLHTFTARESAASSFL